MLEDQHYKLSRVLVCTDCRVLAPERLYVCRAASARLVLAGQLEALQDVMGGGDQSDALSRLGSRVATLEAAAAESEATRRKLHNQLVELRGNVSPTVSLLAATVPDIFSKKRHPKYATVGQPSHSAHP